MVKKTPYERLSAAGERGSESGVSVSIHWRRGGWALAAAIAAIVVGRVLGLL